MRPSILKTIQGDGGRHGADRVATYRRMLGIRDAFGAMDVQRDRPHAAASGWWPIASPTAMAAFETVASTLSNVNSGEPYRLFTRQPFGGAE